MGDGSRPSHGFEEGEGIAQVGASSVHQTRVEIATALALLYLMSAEGWAEIMGVDHLLSDWRKRVNELIADDAVCKP